MEKAARAVIFDFDGVIVDSEPLHYRTFCETLAPLGIKIAKERWYKDFAGTGSRKIISKLFDEFRIERNDEEIIVWMEKRKALYTSYVKQGKLKPRKGLRTFLSKLKTMNPKPALAIASGGHTSHIELILSCLKLENMFDAIIGGEKARNGKPDPEIFLTAAKAIDVKPEKCIVIEDSPAGCEAAVRAGMRLVCFASPAIHLNTQCTKKISSYSEFPLELLEGF